MHHLLLYEYVDGMSERRGPYRDEHLQRIAAARQDRHIVMAGALGDPPSGAAIVFKDVDRARVEEFVAGDPYVRANLVTAHRIEVWNLV